jgi:hypothetical protein
MQIRCDHEKHEVVLTGADGCYQARFSWAAALNLGSLIQQKAQEVEPPAPTGKTYEPKIGRWG